MGLRVETECKHFAAGQFCRERALKGYNSQDLGMKKTTTFTTSGRLAVSYIIADPAGDLYGGVGLLAFAERRAARSEHLLESPTRASARDNGVALETIADIVGKLVREAFVFRRCSCCSSAEICE